MGFAEDATWGLRGKGKAEMRELVRATFAELHTCDLDAVVDDLRKRVFSRRPNELLETTRVDGVDHWSFKPMVELLLRHILHAAETDALSPDARRREILGAIELAGF